MSATKRLEITSLDKGERHRLRSIVLAVVLGIFIASAVIYGKWAHADTRKFENGNATVRFLDTPCELEVEGKAGMRGAQGTFTVVARTPFGMYPVGREDFKGCWKLTDAGYETVWEDGESITFKAKDVQPEGV